MASGYFALMALCCCINGVAPDAFAIGGKNSELQGQKSRLLGRLMVLYG